MATASNHTTQHDWNRLDGVDILRGLAIFLVLMNHVNMRLLLARVPYTQGLPRQLVSSLFWNGQYGVQIFFAISGFLITSTSLRRWGTLSNVQPKEFYALRFARIAPLLLTLLAVLSVLDLTHVHQFVIRPKVANLGDALVAALTLRINVLEATRGYLPGNWDILWSLSVEEMFYLFFPIACLLLRRLNLFAVALLLFVVVGPFGRTALTHGNEVWREYSYLGAMDAIALGCLTALSVSRARNSTRQYTWMGGIVGGLCVAFILMLSRTVASFGLVRTGLDMTVLAVGTCLLLAVAAVTQWKSWKVLAPLRWMGKRSYEIYLSHMFVVLAFSVAFLDRGKPIKLVPLLFATVIVISSSLGELLGRFYSEPMNRLLRSRLSSGRQEMSSVIEEAGDGFKRQR
jgi:peptidoglycan/LPS O-acetylase OafA/YrhL